jgi:hypothetical protein
MLSLLIARPWSSASRCGEAALLNVASMLSESIQQLIQEFREQGPKRKASPSPHYMHAPLSAAESRVQTIH